MWHVLAHGRALACTLDPAYPWLAASSCVHTSQQRATILHSPLLLIPLRGYPQNRRIRRVALLFFFSFSLSTSPLHPFSSIFSRTLVLLSVFVLRFFGNSKRDRDRLAERTGSFTREWSICRAHRVPCFLFSQFYTLGVARELFNLLPWSFFFFFLFPPPPVDISGLKRFRDQNRFRFLFGIGDNGFMARARLTRTRLVF